MERRRAGDDERVGVSRRCDEVDPEALQVVEGVEQRLELALAPVARAAVHVPELHRASEQAVDLGAQSFAQELDRARGVPRGGSEVVGEGCCGLGCDHALPQRVKQDFPHGQIIRSRAGPTAARARPLRNGAPTDRVARSRPPAARAFSLIGPRTRSTG